LRAESKSAAALLKDHAWGAELELVRERDMLDFELLALEADGALRLHSPCRM
jgi:hypothetical protein